MSEPVEFRIVRSRQDRVMDAVTCLLVLAGTVYSMNPGLLEHHWEVLRAEWTKVRYRLSIQRAEREIRDLPETPE